MSTKIYEAYVIKPRHDVWEVLWDIRRRAEKNVRTELTKIYNALIEDAKRSPKAREAIGSLLEVEIDPTRFGYLEASRFVQSQFKKTIGDSNRSPWDMSVSVAVRRASRNRCLLIPYPGSGMLSDALKCMRRHKALADYHYQNASDRPSHITVRAWRERERTWDALLNDDRWQDKLVLDIVTVEGWFRIDPAWNLARKDAHARQEAGTTMAEAVEQVLPAT